MYRQQQNFFYNSIDTNSPSFSDLVVEPTNKKAIGVFDVAAISHEISSSQKNRKPYFRWTDEDRYSIGKYA